MQPAIQTYSLTKHYGALRAVTDLELRVPEGQFHCLVGPNGAGKSTTIKILCGIIRPSYGTASVLGYDIEAEAERVKKLIGYVPENPSIYRALTVKEFLRFIGRIYEVNGALLQERIERYASLFQMKNSLQKYIGSLSKGWLQRVVLCAVFIREPRLLLLDEPFYGLDPEGALVLRTELKEHCRKGGTVLLSTHMLDIADKLCDAVTILDGGKCVVQAPIQQLRSEVGQVATLEQIFLRYTSNRDGEA